jgi:N-acetylneuraminate epimerase
MLAYFLTFCLFGALLSNTTQGHCAQSSPVNHTQCNWSQFPPLPDAEGFASPFAGVAGGALLIAGGANFPNKRPWEGGTKIWYDRVFILPTATSAWIAAGRLPRPNAYGIAVSIPSGVICAGGGDTREHFRDVFLLSRDGQTLHMTPM